MLFGDVCSFIARLIAGRLFREEFYLISLNTQKIPGRGETVGIGVGQGMTLQGKFRSRVNLRIVKC